MNKGIVITIFIVILIGGAFGYFHFIYEKPVQEESYFDANIYAIDDITRDYIPTNYSVYIGGSYRESDMTLSDGAVVKTYPVEQSVLFKSENTEYYNDEVFANPDVLNLSRVEMRLVRPSELKINQSGKFLYDNNITFNLSTKREFRNVIVCAEWSNNFVYVKSNYPQSEEKPSEFDKCFITGETLNETHSINFNLLYKEWGFLTNDDYIKLHFMDSENGIKDYNSTIDKWEENKDITLNINNI